MGGRWNKVMEVSKTGVFRLSFCSCAGGKLRGGGRRADREKGQTYRPFTVHLWGDDHLNIKVTYKPEVPSVPSCIFHPDTFLREQQNISLDKTLWCRCWKSSHLIPVSWCFCCCCCGKTGGWWILSIAISKPAKTATLCSRLPTVSVSPILFNMFVYVCGAIAFC